MSRLMVCGYVVTSDKDIAELFARKDEGSDCWEIFYNNDPFGIIGWTGFEGLEIAEIETDEDSDVLRECVNTGARNAKAGIIRLKNGIFAIQDCDISVKGEIQPNAYEVSKCTPWDKYIDVFDLDDDYDDFDEIAEVLGNSF